MQWQEWSSILVEVLELEKLPVSVVYSDEPVSDASDAKCRVCGALKMAADGQIIDLSEANSACPGGTRHLGLGVHPSEDPKVHREFLTHGEKLYSSPCAIYRSHALAKAGPPVGMAEHVIFSPLSRSPLQPDIVVFICNAWQAARLINLAHFETGEPMECDPTGSLCHSSIVYPLVTGKVNVSFGDVSARKIEKYGVNEMFVTLPYQYLQSAIACMDRCSAGTAKAEIPEGMRRVLKEAGGELPEL